MKLNQTIQMQIQKRMDQVNNALEHTQDWQLIRQFLTNRTIELELNPRQQAKLDMYHFIYSQLATGKYSDKEMLTLLQQDPRYRLEKNLAYAELNATRELFGSTIGINKLFEIRVQLDLNKMLLQKANEANDLRAFAMLEKNRIELLELMPDHDEAMEPLQPHINEITFNPELINAAPVDMRALLAEINSKRKRKINTALFENAIIVDDARKKENSL